MKRLLLLLCILFLVSSCINLDKETIPANVTEEIVPEVTQNNTVEPVVEEIIPEPEPVPKPTPEPQLTEADCDECQYLEDGECKFYECCNDMQCSPGWECRYHECTELDCGPCKHAKGYMCIKNDCCDDNDCEKAGYEGTCENQGSKYAVCKYTKNSS